MTFKVIETQEELDQIIQGRLQREREKYADYEQLQTENADLQTQIASLQQTIEESQTTIKNHDDVVADLKGKIAGFETATLRTQIALKHGIPLDLADRLIGEDEATLKADAERMAGLVKPATPAPMKSTEPKIKDTENSNWAEMSRNLGKGE